MRQFDHTALVDITNYPEKLSRHLHGHKLIMISGMPKCGKHHFMNAYRQPPNFSVSKLSKKPLFDMLHVGETSPNRYYGMVKRFQKEALSELKNEDRHQILIAGRYQTQRSRTEVLSHFNKHTKRVVLVFDGPDELILQRLRESGMDEIQAEDTLEAQRLIFQAPKFREGADIVWVNTFGQEGIDMLREKISRGY